MANGAIFLLLLPFLLLSQLSVSTLPPYAQELRERHSEFQAKTDRGSYLPKSVSNMVRFHEIGAYAHAHCTKADLAVLATDCLMSGK